MMRVILALWLGVMGLANPVSDAELKAGTLSGLGFEVRLVRDGTTAKMGLRGGRVRLGLAGGGARGGGA